MWPFTRDKRFDEPTRLRHFLAAINKEEWADENLLESLNKIFDALNALIQSDVEYYDKRRTKHRRLSNFTRGGALIFGTAGFLAPLLQNAYPECQKLATVGYIFLAIAAAFLAWNYLFGATGGHIRYVMAQLDLGRLITEFRLEWTEWLAKNRGNTPNDEQVKEAFKKFKNFSNRAYQIVQQETKVWGKSTLDALDDYQKSIDVNNGSEKKSTAPGNLNHPTVESIPQTGGESHD